LPFRTLDYLATGNDTSLDLSAWPLERSFVRDGAARGFEVELGFPTALLIVSGAFAFFANLLKSEQSATMRGGIVFLHL
jgi:hypothetical protein